METAEAVNALETESLIFLGFIAVLLTILIGTGRLGIQSRFPWVRLGKKDARPGRNP